MRTIQDIDTVSSGCRSARDARRVLLADPDPIVRRLVRRRLTASHEFLVGCETGDGADAVELACRHRPHVAMLEARMPGLDAVSAISQIEERAPDVRIVVFTAATDAD